MLEADEGAGAAPVTDLAGVVARANQPRVEAAEAEQGGQTLSLLWIRRLHVHRAAEGRVAHRPGVPRAAVNHHVADVLRHEVTGRVMGEIVRVTPGNAVEGDVELTVLKSAYGSPQILHQSGAVRVDRPDAGGEFDDVRVICCRRVIVL